MIEQLLIVFTILALWQIPALLGKRWWRDIIVFFGLWAISFILTVIVSMGIDLPPISTIINKFVIRMFGL